MHANKEDLTRSTGNRCSAVRCSNNTRICPCVHNDWPLTPPWLTLRPLSFVFFSSTVPIVKWQCIHCLSLQCSGTGCSFEGLVCYGSSARFTSLIDAVAQLTLHSSSPDSG